MTHGFHFKDCEYDSNSKKMTRAVSASQDLCLMLSLSCSLHVFMLGFLKQVKRTFFASSALCCFSLRLSRSSVKGKNIKILYVHHKSTSSIYFSYITPATAFDFSFRAKPKGKKYPSPAKMLLCWTLAAHSNSLDGERFTYACEPFITFWTFPQKFQLTR